jgi:hypothetical protein
MIVSNSTKNSFHINQLLPELFNDEKKNGSDLSTKSSPLTSAPFTLLRKSSKRLLSTAKNKSLSSLHTDHHRQLDETQIDFRNNLENSIVINKFNDKNLFNFQSKTFLFIINLN